MPLWCSRAARRMAGCLTRQETCCQHLVLPIDGQLLKCKMTNLPTRLIESASHRWKHQSHHVSREGTVWCGQREVTTVEDAANSLGRRTIEFDGMAVHGKELGRSTERQQAPEHPQITNVASRYAKTSKGTRSTAATKKSHRNSTLTIIHGLHSGSALAPASGGRPASEYRTIFGGRDLSPAAFWRSSGG